MRLAGLLADLPDDVVVVDAGERGDRLDLGPAVEGATLVLLREPVHALPVGRLVDAVCAAEAEVLGVLALDDAQHSSAVLLAPSTSTGGRRVRAMVGRGLVPLEGALALRDAVEVALLADVARAQVLQQRDEAHRERARADAAELRAGALADDVTKVTAELRALRASRTYQVGLAMQEVRRHPVGGLAHLPGALRRAGKGGSSR